MKGRFSFPVFRQPRAVTFGSGSRKELPRALDPERTVLFLSASRVVHERLQSAWGADSPLLADGRVCVKPPGEPTREAVQQGARFLRDLHPRVVVGIGGGSVMDWCRLAWAEASGLLPAELPAAVTIPADATSNPPEFWLVPTTCATGAEAAAVAVLLDGGRKIPVVSDLFLASRAVLDGQFLEGSTPRAMADAMGDALSHAIESFVSIIPNRFAEDAAIAAIERIFGCEEPHHDEHDRLMEAGFLGGVAASNASVGAAHAFAHSVARFGVPHGRANAFALPAAIIANAETPAMWGLLDRLRFDNVGQLLRSVRQATAAEATDDDRRLADRLRGSERAAVAEAMSRDVCLRTNPFRLSADDLSIFVNRVVEAIESA